jgi:hypothetical protein
VPGADVGFLKKSAVAAAAAEEVILLFQLACTATKVCHQL